MSGSTAGHVFPMAACKYCAEEIARNSLGRHEAKCQQATPEDRKHRAYARAEGRRRIRAGNLPMVAPASTPASKKREYQREYSRRYAERRKANAGRPLRELAEATRHASAMLNGKPDDLVELTIALPRSVVMNMLIQGLPHASIVSIGGWRLEQ